MPNRKTNADTLGQRLDEILANRRECEARLQEVDRKVQELKSVRRRLEKEIAELDHQCASVVGCVIPRLPATRSGRKRYKATQEVMHQRAEAVYALLQENSPTKLASIASRLNLSRLEVQAALQRLQREGRVKSTGKAGSGGGWFRTSPG